MDWKEVYKEKLGAVNIESSDIEALQALKIKNMPKKLYKYRAANDNSLNNLTNDTVWLNSPSEYNDPFEFIEFMDADKITNSIGRFRGELIERFKSEAELPESVFEEANNIGDPKSHLGRAFLEKGGFSDHDIDKIIGILNNNLLKAMVDIQNQKVADMQKAMKVCSFCESPDSLLMWGHYTNCHRGFCVEYDLERWSLGDKRRSVLYPVIYQNELYDSTDHIINSIENNTFNVLYPVLAGSIKSKEWEYENEWRFIFNVGHSFERQNYPMDCISKVYLGFRMPEDYKTEVIAICKTKNLPVFQARRSSNLYKLEFDKI